MEDHRQTDRQAGRQIWTDLPANRQTYLDGHSGTLQHVARPQQLGCDRDGGQRRADVTASIKRSVHVVGVMEDVTSYDIVEHSEHDGEDGEAQQHQQRRLVLLHHGRQRPAMVW